MSKTLTPHTLIWAHRGASAYVPENTIPAFELAAEMKADGCETDVYFSKDGKIVVMHDGKIDRTSNGQGYITDYTYDELLAFDFGIKTDARFKGTRIPTMDEVFEICRRNGMTINIEIKTADPEMPAALDACAKAHNMQDGVLYSSFDHEQLARMLRVNPSAFVAPLYGFNMVKPWDYCRNMDAKASHPRYNQIELYPDYVEKCHALGIRVHPWTVDDAEAAKMLADAGCDALITNRPDFIRENLGLAQ